MASCESGQFGPRLDPELGEHVLEVSFDGVAREKQLSSDVGISEPASCQPDHREFRLSQGRPAHGWPRGP